jgi:hypothetical protein
VSAPGGDPLELALAAVGAAEGPVEIAGSGPIAERLRTELGEQHATAGESPRTVVDTTGELGELERLLERVDDLGTVVLAGPAVPSDSTIDFYAEVHVRGLTLVTIAPAP